MSGPGPAGLQAASGTAAEADHARAPPDTGIRCDSSAWFAPDGQREPYRAAARAALTRLGERYRDGDLAFLTALHSGPASTAYLETGRRFARDAEVVVHIGCGGSLHAGKAFAAAARTAGSGRVAPALLFVDEIHPDTCARLLATLDRYDPARVYAVFSSKSGHTTEVLAHFAILLDWYGRGPGPGALRRQAVCLTADRSSPLGGLARTHRIPVLDVPAGVDGRFAAFTVSGLLPAVIGAPRPDRPEPGPLAGGRAVLAAAFPAEGLSDAAEAAAAMAAFHDRHPTGSLVTLAYDSALQPLQAWYRQLAAESLGKAGRGLTPVTATGTDDEHSQLQLWLDGPPGQMFTLVRTPVSRSRPLPVDRTAYPPWFPRRLDTLWNAHFDAAAASLAAAGRPVRTLILARRDQAAYGALMTRFMLETVLLADLLGIDPFGQPAIDGFKNRLVRRLVEATS